MPSELPIDPMGVDNLAFLIENLGRDASPQQELRELVQNAIEAIATSGRKDGQIVIETDLHNGVPKLQITDNGIGMSHEEVCQYLNNMSSSGGSQAFDRNFGIGAKITALTRSPYGVLYKAWRDGEGSVTMFGRRRRKYGRIPTQDSETGELYYWLPLDDEDKHEIIGESGVSVVLLGDNQQQDTAKSPSGADLPSQWITAYLDRRYYRLPPNVTLRVQQREIYDSERGGRRAIYDTVRGQEYYLDKHSDGRGSVELAEVDATVHWWILNEKIGAGGKTWNNRGHVAALYQNELYEVRGGSPRGRASALKDFGIYAGYNRIVISVEPNNVLKANTSRTELILEDDTAVDYVDVGAAFAGQIPEMLTAFMDGEVSSSPRDSRKAIKKRIEELKALLKDIRYRRHKLGRRVNVVPEAGNPPGDDAGAHPRLFGDEIQHRLRRSGFGGTGEPVDEFLRKVQEKVRRKRGSKVKEDPIPMVDWDETGESVPPGRAATYTHASNRITANAVFDGYSELLAWAKEDAKKRLTVSMGDEAVATMCGEEVRKQFEAALVEAVVWVRPWATTEAWGMEAVFDGALSDEGLTTAVMSHRSLMIDRIRRGLGGRIGALKEEFATP